MDAIYTTSLDALSMQSCCFFLLSLQLSTLQIDTKDIKHMSKMYIIIQQRKVELSFFNLGQDGLLTQFVYSLPMASAESIFLCFPTGGRHLELGLHTNSGPTRPAGR